MKQKINIQKLKDYLDNNDVFEAQKIEDPQLKSGILQEITSALEFINKSLDEE